MSKRKGSLKPALLTLILRLAGGGYLACLGCQLIPGLSASSGVRNLIQMTAVAVFSTVGVLLAGWSLKKLIRREFMRPGEKDVSSD